MTSTNLQVESILPLRLTAFEQFMLADDTRWYPMTFFIQIGVTGDLRRAEFANAFQTPFRRL